MAVAPVTLSDFDANLCTCSTVRLGGKDRHVPNKACPIHGTLEGRAETDEDARTLLYRAWAAGREAGWNDRNRIALGIHNQPPTPNPYARKTPQ